MKKAFNIVGVLVFCAAMVSFFYAGQQSSSLIHSSPRSPNVSTGHTVEMVVKGIGTVYLTQSEWDSIAPYWNTFYGLMGLFVALIVGRVLLEGWFAFLKGYRSGNP